MLLENLIGLKKPIICVSVGREKIQIFSDCLSILLDKTTLRNDLQK